MATCHLLRPFLIKMPAKPLVFTLHLHESCRKTLRLPQPHTHSMPLARECLDVVSESEASLMSYINSPNVPGSSAFFSLLQGRGLCDKFSGNGGIIQSGFGQPVFRLLHVFVPHTISHRLTCSGPKYSPRYGRRVQLNASLFSCRWDHAWLAPDQHCKVTKSSGLNRCMRSL